MGRRGLVNRSRSALVADRMSALHSLLPNKRIPPQEMFSDSCSGQSLSAEGADFFHGWIDVVRLMCGPGGAGFGTGKRAAVMKQSQGDADAYGHSVKERIK